MQSISGVQKVFSKYPLPLFAAYKRQIFAVDKIGVNVQQSSAAGAFVVVSFAQ